MSILIVKIILKCILPSQTVHIGLQFVVKYENTLFEMVNPQKILGKRWKSLRKGKEKVWFCV